MNTQTPVNSQVLNGWDGNSRKGQAAYDRHFEFEMSFADAMDIVQNPDPELYSQDQIEAAYETVKRYK